MYCIQIIIYSNDKNVRPYSSVLNDNTLITFVCTPITMNTGKNVLNN